MCGDKLSYHLFIDSSKKYVITGNETTDNFYYNIQGLLPNEHEKYYVQLEYVLLLHNATADTKTYKPFDSRIFNVMINFDKGENIYDAENYLNVYTGICESYKKYSYWNTSSNAVNYDYNMDKSCSDGYNGPVILINRPRNIINIKILNGSDEQLLDIDGGTINKTKIMLKFTPFIECHHK